MSEQLAEDQIAAEADGTGLVCPDCGERFKNKVSFGLHKRNAHGIASERADRNKQRYETRKSTGNKGAELNRLRRELKKDVNALCLLPFMAKGTADNLTNPAVTAVIDEKAEGFADAWVTVAEQNDWVRVNLTRALSGGVWLHAAAQTAALGYVVAVFSGFVPLHPGAMMLIPEMGQFAYRPAAETNGAAAAKEPSGDQVA